MKYSKTNSKRNQLDHNRSKKHIKTRIKWYKIAIKKVKKTKASQTSINMIVTNFSESIKELTSIYRNKTIKQ